ncbi:uncharacterized protein A4U43_C03F20 [Asparagus officinalis]|uniref:Uncharacterized protein n=1 Tax=Asparagus officinalis TaxID=4686 RepID=A0A5P1FBC2_ASPOF|nr:uncharacterized protein A4U43_C03F20 [Asparagus officinalis]
MPPKVWARIDLATGQARAGPNRAGLFLDGFGPLEWNRMMTKFIDVRKAIDELTNDWAEEWDYDEEFRAGRVRLKTKLDELQSVVDFLDGIDRYLPGRHDAYSKLRDSVVRLVRDAHDLLHHVDEDIHYVDGYIDDNDSN